MFPEHFPNTPEYIYRISANPIMHMSLALLWKKLRVSVMKLSRDDDRYDGQRWNGLDSKLDIRMKWMIILNLEVGRNRKKLEFPRNKIRPP